VASEGRMTPNDLAREYARLSNAAADLQKAASSLSASAERLSLHADSLAVPQELRGEPTPLKPTWMSIAEGEIGTREHPGAANNIRVMEYHSATSGGEKPDSVPWCASFVCWCFEKAGMRHTRSKSARSYLTWGIPLDKPQMGCVVVLKRGTPPSGHVGFWAGPERILGGNQSNAVSVKDYDESDVLSYRWPKEE